MNLYLHILFVLVDSLYYVGTGLRWISGGLFLWNRNKNEFHSIQTIRGVRPVFNIWQRLTPRRVPSVVGFISGLEILFLNWLLLNLTPTGFAPWIQCHLLNVLFLGI